MSEDIIILPSGYGWIPLVGLLLLIAIVAARILYRRFIDGPARDAGAPEAAQEHDVAPADPDPSPQEAPPEAEADDTQAPVSRGINLATTGDSEPSSPQDTAIFLAAAHASAARPKTDAAAKHLGHEQPDEADETADAKDEARTARTPANDVIERYRSELKALTRDGRARSELQAKQTIADIIDEEEQRASKRAAEPSDLDTSASDAIELGRPAPNQDASVRDDTVAAEAPSEPSQEADRPAQPEPEPPVERPAAAKQHEEPEAAQEAPAGADAADTAAPTEIPDEPEQPHDSDASGDPTEAPAQKRSHKPRGRSLAGPRSNFTRPSYESISDLIDDQMGFARLDLGPAKALAGSVGSKLAGLRERRASSAESPGSRWSASTIAWLALDALLLLVFSIFCFTGMVEDDLFSVWQFTLIALGMGGVCLLRDPTFALLEKLEAEGARGRIVSEVVRGVRDLALLVLGVWMSLIAIEMPWNPEFLNIHSSFVALEAATIALALLCLYFLFQRHGAGPALGVVIFLLIGIAQYFVREFKDVPIVPTDLLALGTAQAVAGQYVYTLGKTVVRAASLALISIMSFSFMRPGRAHAPVARTANLAVNLVLALVMGFSLRGFVSAPPMWKDAYGTHVYYWELFDYYESEGFLPTFVTIAQDLPIQQPEGYSEDEARELLKSYTEAYDSGEGANASRKAAQAQFDDLKPSVVVVMNETFADMSVYDKLHAGYDGPQFFRYGMADSIAHGPLAVSVRGGGTCNTEFELLTGNSMAWVGANKYPYSMYDMGKVDNLAAQFKSWGYHTTALHPNLASNWNRDVVYQAMGFDDFVTIDDFERREDMDFFHNGVPDYLTYQNVLEILREGGEPQFVFDVTMQNHGGYEVHNIPQELMCDYHPADFDDNDTNAQLNEYLACIEASDRALEWFVSQLSQLGKPVVLVFFGDHQAGFVNTYNNALFPDENGNEAPHWSRTYATDYVVWTNYALSGRENSDLVDPVSDTRLSIRSRREQFTPEEQELMPIGRIWTAEDGPTSLWTQCGVRYDGLVAQIDMTAAHAPGPDDAETPLAPARDLVSTSLLTDDAARSFINEFLNRRSSWASASDLGALTLHLIGAPLSDYQKAQIALRDDIDALNGFAYRYDNTWYELKDQSDGSKRIEEFRKIDFLHFGSKVQE